MNLQEDTQETDIEEQRPFPSPSSGQCENCGASTTVANGEANYCGNCGTYLGSDSPNPLLGNTRVF